MGSGLPCHCTRPASSSATPWGHACRPPQNTPGLQARTRASAAASGTEGHRTGLAKTRTRCHRNVLPVTSRPPGSPALPAQAARGQAGRHGEGASSLGTSQRGAGSSSAKERRGAGGGARRGVGCGLTRGLTRKDTGVAVVRAAAVQDQGDAVQLVDLQRGEHGVTHTAAQSAGGHGGCFSVFFPSSSLYCLCNYQPEVFNSRRASTSDTFPSPFLKMWGDGSRTTQDRLQLGLRSLQFTSRST